MPRREIGRTVFIIASLLLLGTATITGIRIWQPPSNEGLTPLANAARNYYLTYGEFPPAIIYDQHGAPMHSWRVLLVPFIEANTFYDAYDFTAPWNAPVNIGLAKNTKSANPSKALAPADVGEIFTGNRGKPSRNGFTTNFLLLSRVRSERKVFRKAPTHDELLLMSAIPSVPDEFIIIQLNRTATHWMEPRDLSLARMPSNGDIPWENVQDDIQASVKITNSHVSFFNRSETLDFLDSLEQASVHVVKTTPPAENQ